MAVMTLDATLSLPRLSLTQVQICTAVKRHSAKKSRDVSRSTLICGQTRMVLCLRKGLGKVQIVKGGATVELRDVSG